MSLDNWKGPTRRLWLSDLTPPAIVKALDALKPIAETTPYALAAEARQQADWLVGMNATRAATLKMRESNNSSLVSIGRVQTPTLALIVRREREIQNFKPEPYFDIRATARSAGGEEVILRPDTSLPKPKTPQEAQAVMAKLRGGTGAFTVNVEDKVKKPPKLLDLDTLQQQANRLFGMTSDATLKAAQSLYEEHRMLTYPRTDCRFLPEEQKPLAKTILANILPLFRNLDLSGFDPEKAIIGSGTYNDRQITAHHAIVPTLQTPDIGGLDANEKNVYTLVCRYFAAAHMPDHVYQATSIELEIEGITLIARGKKTRVSGWRALFDGMNEDAEDETELPGIADGEQGEIIAVDAEAKETQPPSRYTEGTLLKAMKNVASLVEDETLKKALRNAAGIGTPATRANIIEVLKKRQFIATKKKSLVPTDLGMSVVGVVERIVPHYADPAVTASWESQLEAIVSRGYEPERFIGEIKDRVTRDIETMKTGSLGDLVKASPGRRSGTTPSKGGRRFGAGSGAGSPKQFAQSKLKKIDPGSVTYLEVAYDRRDLVKSLGGRWDPEKKKWYILDEQDKTPFIEAGFLSP